jgi:hypothetical protein
MCILLSLNRSILRFKHWGSMIVPQTHWQFSCVCSIKVTRKLLPILTFLCIHKYTMKESMSNSNITVNDFKEFYLQMSQPRSIRRLHAQLKKNFRIGK